MLNLNVKADGNKNPVIEMNQGMGIREFMVFSCHI